MERYLYKRNGNQMISKHLNPKMYLLGNKKTIDAERFTENPSVAR